MKKKNGLLYGVAALAVLCAVYIGVGQYMDSSQEKNRKQEEESKVFMTDLSTVTAVSYDFNGQELSFTKKDDTWKYDGDELFPVKQMKIDSLVTTASKLEALRKLDGGDSLSAYGLDKPVRKVTVITDNGKKSVILLGSTTQDGDYYALLEGEDVPYLISSSLYSDTDSGLDDLLALEEFPSIAGTDIQSITIKKADATEHYVKKKLDDEEGTVEWYRDSADSPENKLSDNSGLNVLADSLCSLSVKSCPDYKVQDSDLAGYGLDNPTAVITYTYDKNGKEETFTLNIGSLNGDSSCYYTRTKDSRNVNEIDKASIDKCLTVEKGI